MPLALQGKISPIRGKQSPDIDTVAESAGAYYIDILTNTLYTCTLIKPVSYVLYKVDPQEIVEYNNIVYYKWYITRNDVQTACYTLSANPKVGDVLIFNDFSVSQFCISAIDQQVTTVRYIVSGNEYLWMTSLDLSLWDLLSNYQMDYSSQQELHRLVAATADFLHGLETDTITPEIEKLDKKYKALEQYGIDVVNKYKNIAVLSSQALQALIIENGYSYIVDYIELNHLKLKQFVYYLPLIHCLKETKTGLELLLACIAEETRLIEWWEETFTSTDGYTKNYETAGTVTISDTQVVTNISSGAYIKLTQPVSIKYTDDFCITVKFRTRTDNNIVNNWLIRNGYGNDDSHGVATNCGILLNGKNISCYYMYKKPILSTDFKLDQNTWYIFKFMRVGTTYYAILEDVNGVKQIDSIDATATDWVPVSSYIGSLSVYGKNSTYQLQAYDLKSTTVEIVPYLKSDRLKQPTQYFNLHNYTVTGNPSINRDGIYSRNSTADKVCTASQIEPGTKDFYASINFNSTGTAISGPYEVLMYIPISGSSNCMLRWTAGKLLVFKYDTVQVTLSGINREIGAYQIICTKDDDAITLTIYKDGELVNTGSVSLSTTLTSPSGQLYIGSNNTGAYGMNSCLNADLKHVMIKVDNEVVFLGRTGVLQFNNPTLVLSAVSRNYQYEDEIIPYTFKIDLLDIHERPIEEGMIAGLISFCLQYVYPYCVAIHVQESIDTEPLYFYIAGHINAEYIAELNLANIIDGQASIQPIDIILDGQAVTQPEDTIVDAGDAIGLES